MTSEVDSHLKLKKKNNHDTCSEVIRINNPTQSVVYPSEIRRHSKLYRNKFGKVSNQLIRQFLTMNLSLPLSFSSLRYLSFKTFKSPKNTLFFLKMQRSIMIYRHCPFWMCAYSVRWH